MNKKREVSSSPPRKTGQKSILKKTTEVFDIYIDVFVKDKRFRIYCADGKQKFKWLMDAAMQKFDKNYSFNLGLPPAMRLESGELCDYSEMICSQFNGFGELRILLKGNNIFFKV
jgi:hypothetical protein